jgi:hypothetical protein
MHLCRKTSKIPLDNHNHWIMTVLPGCDTERYQFPRCWQQKLRDKGTNFQGADNRNSETKVPISKVLTTSYLILACHSKQKNNQRGFKCIHPIIHMSGNSLHLLVAYRSLSNQWNIIFACTSGDQIVTQRIILYVNKKRVFTSLFIDWPMHHTEYN